MGRYEQEPRIPEKSKWIHSIWYDMDRRLFSILDQWSFLDLGSLAKIRMSTESD